LPARILDGKSLSQELLGSLKSEIASLKGKPGLAVVLVGDDPASILYTRKKLSACEAVGIYSEEFRIDKPGQEELALLIDQLNHDDKIHGILVQLPLPRNIDTEKILSEVSPEKDVDGFGPVSLGGLMLNKPGLVSCTALGIMKLLSKYKIGLKGKNAVIIGDSVIIGRPLSHLLLNERATVTICHSETKDLDYYTSNADILVSATGVPGLIKGDMVKKGVVAIDVGTAMVDGKVIGDMAKEVYDKASFITPVPGGVGPMTVACLMENTVQSYLGRGSKL
jgi:methylenetetrahydrofolate dehydrogenase (NADP+) / methenyltetrahydrofolate cyclohydrolase